MNRFTKPAFNRISTATQRRKESTQIKSRVIPRGRITFIDEVVIMPFNAALFERFAIAHAWANRGDCKISEGAHIMFWDGETK